MDRLWCAILMVVIAGTTQMAMDYAGPLNNPGAALINCGLAVFMAWSLLGRFKFK